MAGHETYSEMKSYTGQKFGKKLSLECYFINELIRLCQSVIGLEESDYWQKFISAYHFLNECFALKEMF